MKKELVNLINNNNWTSLPDFFKKHVAKNKSKADLEEVLSEFSRPQQEELCKGIHNTLVKQFPVILYDEESEELDTDSSLTDISPEDRKNAEELCKYVLELTILYVKTLKSNDDDQPHIHDELLQTAILTSGVLPALKGSLSVAAVAFTEAWVINKFEESDHVSVNVFLSILKECIIEGAKKVEVKRLYALRSSLELLPLSKDNLDKSIQQLLIQAFKTTVFLTCDEGIALFALLYNYATLVPLLHDALKEVLPNCTLAQSKKYGEVYFRVWKKSQGEQREFFEEKCLQDLMYKAMHIDPYGSRLSNNVQQFLSYIHRQKRHTLAADMLCQLYQPFIWRSLKVANGIVRMNAVTMLCDVFPFTDSTLNQEEMEELLERQYSAIIAMLSDQCHLVRIAAIKGVTLILCNYWLMIPAHVIKKIFKLFLADLAVDASSSEVRCLVVKSLTGLLDCKCALPFIMQIISKIAGSFDDVNTNVRIAFIKLLLKIKATKCVKYWEVVSMEHLLTRLEMDGPSVGKLITKLMMHSFFPTNVADEELLHRSFSLMEENRGAARKFYYYASRSMDINTTVRFMLLIWKTVRQYIVHEQQNSTTFSVEGNDSQVSLDLAGPSQNKSSNRSRSSKSTGSSCKENKAPNDTTNQDKDDTGSGEEDSDDDDIGLNNPEVVAGLFDTVAILWASNVGKLKKPENLKYNHALNTKISSSLPLFCTFFKENSEVTQTLLYISSFLPRSTVPTLVGHCLSKLRSLENIKKEDSNHVYITYVNALCNWNRTDDIIELVSDSLEKGLKIEAASASKDRRKRSRGVRFQEIQAMNPSLALKVLHHILEHPLNRLAVLPQKTSEMKTLVSLMATVMDLTVARMDHDGPLSSECTDEFLIDCWEEYLSLLIVLNNKSPLKDHPNENSEPPESENTNTSELADFSCLPQYNHCLEWATKTLLPALMPDNSEDTGKRSLPDKDDIKDICWTIVSSILYLASNVVIVGAADFSFCTVLCEFTIAILKLEPTTEVIGRCLGVASEVSEFCNVYEDRGHAAAADDQPLEIIRLSLSMLAQLTTQEAETNQNFTVIKNKIVSSLLLLSQHSEIHFQEIINYIVKLVFDSLSDGIEKVKGVEEEITRVKDLDKVSAFYVSIMQSRAKFSSEFMSALSNIINNEIQDIKHLLACIHLLSVLKEDSGKISRYNLKQAVMTADTVMSGLVMSEDEEEDSDIHGFARLYVKSCKKILSQLKTNMGIL